MGTLGWLTLFTILGNVFAAINEYTTPDKPQIIKGPRDDLNETGRFLFPHPHSSADLLCKNCSTRALHNGQYRDEQEVVCINKNYGKMEPYASFNIYPYCKIGSDLVCGNPPSKGKNTYWNCYPAYSPTNYSVYSTCQLKCNTSIAVIGQIYCSEKLTWHTDWYSVEECEQPVTPDKGTKDETTTILLVCVLAMAVIIAAVVLICVCYRRKKKLSRPPSSDTVENGTAALPEEIPLTARGSPVEMDRGNSIGDCSIDDGVSERSQLLPTAMAQSLKVDMSTSTSTLNTCGQNGGQLDDRQDGAGQSGLGVSNRSTSSQTDNGHHIGHSTISTSNTSNTDSGHNGQGGRSGLGLSNRSSSSQTDNRHHIGHSTISTSNTSNTDSGHNGQGGQSGLGLSNRSSSSQTDNGHHIGHSTISTSNTCEASNIDNGNNGQGKGYHYGQNALSDNSTKSDGSEVGQSRRGPSGTSGSSCTDSVQSGQGNRFEVRPVGLGSSSISSCSHADSEHSENENGSPGEQQIGSELRNSVRSRTSNTDSEQEKGQNGLRSSGRSTSSQINNQPYLKMFPPETDSKSRCESGLNKLQENAYSVQTGSSFYFVPSQTNVVEVKITRKGEGPPFRGSRCIGPNSFVLENVTFEDAGMYIYTITLELNGEIKTWTDFFEIFVADSSNQSRDIGGPCQTPRVENQKVQRSTVVKPFPPNQLNHAGGSQNDESGNMVPSGRVPPEGAENQAPQASGQGHPKFYGARPKTRQILAPTVVSPASIGGNKDPQPMRNNLDLSQITSGVDKTKLDNMNISTDLPSLEDNRLTESLPEDLKGEIVRDWPSNNLHLSSLLSSEGNPPYSQQNDLNNVEELSNTDNISNYSVEQTSVELDKLKAHESDLDFSEILDSTGKTSSYHVSNSSNMQNPVGAELQLSEGPRSLSHLEIATLEETSHTDRSVIQTIRPDPSGRSDQPQVIEDNRHETEPKVIYRRNEDVRGEQTTNNSSVLNQPQARVRLTSDRVNSGQRNVGQETHVEGTLSDFGQKGEPRRELNETVQGAVGGVPILDGMFQQRLEEDQGASQCITRLKDLNDTVCLQHICWLGNPREENSDAKTWFGLCLFYNHERHKLNAIAYALRTDPYNGPMYHALTKLLVQQNLTVGHVVYYYTLETSYNPDIVERFVDKCTDHVNCEYCQGLSRMAKLRYQSH